jgi:hypothetical protein
MENLISKIKTAFAFQSGNRFKFPDDETVYEFWYIEYQNKEPVVRYYDENGNGRARTGFHLSDLILV